MRESAEPTLRGVPAYWSNGQPASAQLQIPGAKGITRRPDRMSSISTNGDRRRQRFASPD